MSDTASKAQAAATRLTSQIDTWSPRPYAAKDEGKARPGQDIRPASHGVFQHLGNVADSVKKIYEKLNSPIQDLRASPDKNIQPGKSSIEEVTSTSRSRADTEQEGNQVGEDTSIQPSPAARINASPIILNNGGFLPDVAPSRQSPNLEFKDKYSSLSLNDGSLTNQIKAGETPNQPSNRPHHQEKNLTEQRSTESPKQVPNLTESDGQKVALQGGQEQVIHDE